MQMRIDLSLLQKLSRLQKGMSQTHVVLCFQAFRLDSLALSCLRNAQCALFVLLKRFYFCRFDNSSYCFAKNHNSQT